MLNFAANLSFFWSDKSLLEKFSLAKKLGFKGVEYLFPYNYAKEVLREHLAEHQLEQVLFNTPPGDWSCGERGIASLANRKQEFRESLERALEYATCLNTKRVHTMAGLRDRSISFEKQTEIFKENLLWAARLLEPYGVELLIEPINRRDMPDYFLNTIGQAEEIIDALSLPNLKLQFDIYHCQVSEGDVETKLRRYYPITGHYQLAGVPKRHEPSEGELNYDYILAVIDELGFSGWIGCEYRPKTSTEEGIGWLKRWR